MSESLNLTPEQLQEVDAFNSERQAEVSYEHELTPGETYSIPYESDDEKAHRQNKNYIRDYAERQAGRQAELTQAYKDIVDPRHVISLKESIDVTAEMFTPDSKNVKLGRDISSEKASTRDRYVEEYLQTGDREKSRPIPDEIRAELEELLSLSFEELEEKVRQREAAENTAKIDSGYQNYIDSKQPEPQEPDEPESEPDPTPDSPPQDDNTLDENNDQNNTSEDQEMENNTPDQEAAALAAEQEAARNQILQQIDEADSMTNRKLRAEALADIARRNKMTGASQTGQGQPPVYSFVDLGLEAAKRISQSQQHGRLRSRRLGNTKKFGEWQSLQETLFEELANANSDNDYGIEAAQEIDWSYLRNKVLAQIAKQTFSRVHGAAETYHHAETAGASQDELAAILQRGTYFGNLHDTARGLMSGRKKRHFSDEIELHKTQQTGNPEDLAGLSLRAFSKKQKALYDIAVARRDQSIAAQIKKPKLRRKAYNEIKRRNATQS